MRQATSVWLFLLVLTALCPSCGRPSAANIELRKQNAALGGQIEEFERRHRADQASIRALESSAATMPSLPRSRLEKLFTVHGLKLGKLTGGADLDRSVAGHEGLVIYAVPVDQDGDELKAAGSFNIEAFDLALPVSQKIGQWTFRAEEAKKNWNSVGLLYCYVLRCRWQNLPTHGDLTIKVTFTDELTGRAFTEQRVVKIDLPGPSQ